MPVDYLSLMTDRAKKADAARRPIRYPICLDLDLLADLQEAEEEHRQLVVANIGEDEKPRRDARAGDLSPVDAAEARVEQIKQQVAEHSVLGVFRVPTATRQAELHDKLNAAQKDRPDEQNVIVIGSAKDTIVECFVRFDRLDHEPIPGLNREHLVADLEVWPEGVLLDLANKIREASMGAPDIPKSGRSSQPSRPSAAT
jgi:hypothetical protein